jgi:hypothetical protein
MKTEAAADWTVRLMASVAANIAVPRVTIITNAVLFCITLYD